MDGREQIEAEVDRLIGQLKAEVQEINRIVEETDRFLARFSDEMGNPRRFPGRQSLGNGPICPNHKSDG